MTKYCITYDVIVKIEKPATFSDTLSINSDELQEDVQRNIKTFWDRSQEHFERSGKTTTIAVRHTIDMFDAAYYLKPAFFECDSQSEAIDLLWKALEIWYKPGKVLEICNIEFSDVSESVTHIITKDNLEEMVYAIQTSEYLLE